MQINPTNKAISIVGAIDFLLFGNSETLNTEYSLTDRIRNVNIAWDEVVADLYKADPNHKWDDTTNTDLPFATLDLAANRDHYTLLDSALVIHRVRVKDRNGKYKTLNPAVRSELTDSELNGSGDPEKYYKIGGVIFPVPVPNYGYAGGVELEFQRGGNHFTTADTTAEPGFNSQFHKILAVSAALDYAIANGMVKKINVLTAEKDRIRKQMIEHYQMRSPDEKPKLKLKPRSFSNYGL